MTISPAKITYRTYLKEIRYTGVFRWLIALFGGETRFYEIRAVFSGDKWDLIPGDIYVGMSGTLWFFKRYTDFGPLFIAEASLWALDEVLEDLKFFFELRGNIHQHDEF